MTDWDSEKAKSLLSAIAHPSRAAILEFLANHDFGTNKALRRHLSASRSKSGGDSAAVVTHHISLLEKTGLVTHSKDDRRIILITAAGRRIVRLLRQLVSEIETDEVWDRSL